MTPDPVARFFPSESLLYLTDFAPVFYILWEEPQPCQCDSTALFLWSLTSFGPSLWSMSRKCRRLLKCGKALGFLRHLWPRDTFKGLSSILPSSEQWGGAWCPQLSWFLLAKYHCQWLTADIEDSSLCWRFHSLWIRPWRKSWFFFLLS